MTDRQEAIARVRAYVEAWPSLPDAHTVSVIGGRDRTPQHITLGDLRALLSALELGSVASLPVVTADEPATPSDLDALGRAMLNLNADRIAWRKGNPRPALLTLRDMDAIWAALSASTTDSGRLDAEARLHVDEAMVERALHARVPGGSEVWCWLPQKDAWTPHQTARDVMECALSAALNASQAHVKHKAEGGCEPPPAPSDRGRG